MSCQTEELAKQVIAEHAVLQAAAQAAEVLSALLVQGLDAALTQRVQHTAGGRV